MLDEVSRGMALEFLANGAEYLVNSRVYTETVTQPALDWEAVHILLRLSREVFEEHVGPSQRVC
ncbi:MAG TPA: hypothetical protein VGB69_12315 [Edaphobacter sp.]